GSGSREKDSTPLAPQRADSRAGGSSSTAPVRKGRSSVITCCYINTARGRRATAATERESGGGSDTLRSPGCRDHARTSIPPDARRGKRSGVANRSYAGAQGRIDTVGRGARPG